MNKWLSKTSTWLGWLLKMTYAYIIQKVYAYFSIICKKRDTNKIELNEIKLNNKWMNNKTWFKISCFYKVLKAWWYTEKHTDEFSCVVLNGKWECAANGCVQLYLTNVNKLTHFLGLPLGLFSPVVSAFCKCQQPWISGRYFIKCFKQIFQAHNLSQAESFSYTATKGEG